MFKINCLCCPRKQTRLESKLIHTADKIQFNQLLGLSASELNWIEFYLWCESIYFQTRLLPLTTQAISIRISWNIYSTVGVSSACEPWRRLYWQSLFSDRGWRSHHSQQLSHTFCKTWNSSREIIKYSASCFPWPEVSARHLSGPVCPAPGAQAARPVGVAAEAVAGKVQVRLGGHHQHVRLARPDGDGDLSLAEAGSSESAEFKLI